MGGMFMRRIFLCLFSAILCLGLIGCGANSEEQAPESEESTGSPIEYEENLLTVDVTVPSSIFTDKTDDEILEAANENGYLNCVINDDRSVTYTMTKAKHSEMMQQFKALIDEGFNNMVNGDDAVKSFKSIEYSDDLSLINVYVDSSAYTEFDTLYCLGFYIYGAYYQGFAGIDPDSIDIVINYIDDSTGETLDSMSYRAFIENLNNQDNAESS
jgi:hypothetical protein